MASFTEQLQGVKLKKSPEPTKDYSSPKLAGFVSQQEVDDYQNSVLDVNIECWMEALVEHTFKTSYCPITLDDAQLFVSLYERHFSSADPSLYNGVRWRDSLSEEERRTLEAMKSRLQLALDEFLAPGEHAFVKTSSRSAKDAPLHQSRLEALYGDEVQLAKQRGCDVDSKENEQITCLLRAAFEAMKVSSADEVLDMFVGSERIYQDMLLAVQLKDRFREHFVLRKFVYIDVDMEFRGFVFDSRLVALSQYNYLIHSERLYREHEKLTQRIKTFFDDVVSCKLNVTKFPTSYIIDFAVCDQGQKIYVIEINPFLNTTDAALFSWEHERHLLKGQIEGFHVRVALRCKPGSTTMLPLSARQLLQRLHGKRRQSTTTTG